MFGHHSVGLILKILVVVLATLCISVVTAQAAVTGSLHVRVLDERGVPVAGAEVAVSSNTQLGRRAQKTNDEGTVRFNALEPGNFDVTVSAPGRGTVVQTRNAVRRDETTFLVIHLSREIVETVTVEGRLPLVDTSSTTVGQDLPSDFVDAVPISRTASYQMFVLPGVEYGFNPWVHGGTDRDNLYLIDSINTTDPVTGTVSNIMNNEIVSQHNITTAGHMAEYGGVVGAISSLVTKSGGNTWSGSVNGLMLDKDWYSDFDKETEPTSRGKLWVASYTLGGPIVRDHLWHFTSFQKERQKMETLVPDSSIERPPGVADIARAFAKLTWQAHENHQICAQIAATDGDLFNLNSASTYYKPEQFNFQRQPYTGTALRYTGILGPKTVLEAQLNLQAQELDNLPQYPEAGPNVYAVGASGQFGRWYQEYFSDRDRNDLRLDVSLFVPRGPGEHNLRVGAQAYETDFHTLSLYSGGERFQDRGAAGRTMWSIFGPGTGLYSRFLGFESNNPGWECYLGGLRCAEQEASPSSFTNPGDWQLVVDGTAYDPSQFTYDEPSINADAADAGWVRYRRFAHGELGNVGDVGQNVLALYAQDDWRLGRLTLRLGVRAERQKLYDSLGRHLFTFDTTIAPRIGLVYDSSGEGRKKLYAHYGRLYDPMRDNTPSYAGQYGLPLSESQYWLAPFGDFFTYSSSGGSRTPTATIAPKLETPYTDEFLLGYALQLKQDMLLEITGMRRVTRNVAEDFDPIYGLGDPEIYPQLQSGPTLKSLGFPDRNGDGVVDMDDIDTRYVVYNPPGAEKNYEGIDVLFRKRFSNGWRLLASYTWADFKSSLTNDSLFQMVGDDAYRDPRLPHNYGRVPVRDHSIKAFGSYRFPFGLQIGGGLVWLSGTHRGLWGVRSPDGNIGFWDGDPAKIVDTLYIDRAEFSESLAIPETLPDGSPNPELDRAVIGLIPFDLRIGRGAYESRGYWYLDLRLRYYFRLAGRLNGEAFFDVYNLTDEQETTSRSAWLQTNPGVRVDSTNISERSIYRFGDSTANQTPRRYYVGARFSF